MFNDLRLSTRLALGSGVVTLLLLMLVGTSAYRRTAISDAIAEMIDDRYAKVSLSNDIIRRSIDNGRQVRNLVLMTAPAAAEVRKLAERSQVARRRSAPSRRPPPNSLNARFAFDAASGIDEHRFVRF